jgi:hypothetical protein
VFNHAFRLVLRILDCRIFLLMKELGVYNFKNPARTVWCIQRRSMMTLARVSGSSRCLGREPDEVTTQALLAHRLHQPSGLTWPATSLQVFDSAMKCRHPPHFCSPFG